MSNDKKIAEQQPEEIYIKAWQITYNENQGNILTATGWNILSTAISTPSLLLLAVSSPFIDLCLAGYNLVKGNFKQAGFYALAAIMDPLCFAIVALAEPIRYQAVIFSYPFRDLKYNLLGHTHPNSIPILDNYASSLLYNADINVGRRFFLGEKLIILPPLFTCLATLNFFTEYAYWAIEKVLGLPTDSHVNRLATERISIGGGMLI